MDLGNHESTKRLKELSVFVKPFLELATDLGNYPEFGVCSAVDHPRSNVHKRAERKDSLPLQSKSLSRIRNKNFKDYALGKLSAMLSARSNQPWHVHSAIPRIKDGFLPKSTFTHLTASRASTSQAFGPFPHFWFVKNAALVNSCSAATSFAI